METCDVCKLVFTSAAPNKAVADAKIRTHGVPGTITKLPVEEETHV